MVIPLRGQRRAQVAVGSPALVNNLQAAVAKTSANLDYHSSQTVSSRMATKNAKRRKKSE
jgi:hypothetical protein